MNLNVNVYSEVYSVLLELGENYMNKIPRKFLEHIENERNLEYNPKYDFEKNIENQISNDALTFIAYLNLEYWANDAEREELLKKYKENETLYNRVWEEKTNNMFKKNNIEKTKGSEETKLVKYKKNVLPLNEPKETPVFSA